MKFKFMKMWKLYIVKVTRLKLTGRYINNTIAKLRCNQYFMSWLVLTGRCLEQKKVNRLTKIVNMRLTTKVFNNWYSFAVARETKRGNLSMTHFQAWLRYTDYKRKKQKDLKKGDKQHLIVLLRKGIQGLFRKLRLVRLHTLKMKLSLKLRHRHRIRTLFRKMIKKTRFKKAIKATERTFHYWKHLTYGPNRKVNSVLCELPSINRPDAYTNNKSNCERIHTIRLFSNWKKFVRTNLLMKVRIMIRRWKKVVMRTKKVIIAASTMFNDAGNKIRKYNAFQLLVEKVAMIRGWKQVIYRWGKPMSLIDKRMRLLMLRTRFRLWYLATGPAVIIETKRILRKLLKLWKKEYIACAFCRYIQLRKVTSISIILLLILMLIILLS